MMSRACEFSISERMILPLATEIDPRAHAGLDDAESANPAMHDVVRQVHHVAEAMIHDGQPPVGAEHAKPVRHVVQGGVELVRQRRFAFTREQRAHEDHLQAG